MSWHLPMQSLQTKVTCIFSFYSSSMHLSKVGDCLFSHNPRMGIPARHKLNIPWLHMQGTPSGLHVVLHEASTSGQTDLRLCGGHMHRKSFGRLLMQSLHFKVKCLCGLI